MGGQRENAVFAERVGCSTTSRCRVTGFLNIDWGPVFADSNP
jgi:hypothetical protein